MNRSKELNELFSALAKVQSSMPAAVKTSINPFFKSVYADMREIVNVSRQLLSQNNLCILQPIVQEGDKHVLLTVLGHSSGQYITSRVMLNPTKQDPQSFGSYITYMKRYAYAAIIGVVTEDDDGEAAMERLTKEQASILYKLINGRKDIEQRICSAYKIDKLDQLPSSHFESLCSKLTEK